MNQYKLYLRNKYQHFHLTQSIILGAIISATMFAVYYITTFTINLFSILLNILFHNTSIFVFILLYIFSIYAYQASLYTIIYNK